MRARHARARPLYQLLPAAGRWRWRRRADTHRQRRVVSTAQRHGPVQPVQRRAGAPACGFAFPDHVPSFSALYRRGGTAGRACRSLPPLPARSRSVRPARPRRLLVAPTGPALLDLAPATGLLKLGLNSPPRLAPSTAAHRLSVDQRRRRCRMLPLARARTCARPPSCIPPGSGRRASACRAARTHMGMGMDGPKLGLGPWMGSAMAMDMGARPARPATWLNQTGLARRAHTRAPSRLPVCGPD